MHFVYILQSESLHRFYIGCAADVQARLAEHQRVELNQPAAVDLGFWYIRKEAVAWGRGGTVHHSVTDELNRLMAERPMMTRQKTSGVAYATELWFEAHEPEDLFAPLAHSAAALFTHAGRNRVRKCANCVLHFYDTSKKGTRRWCSMQFVRKPAQGGRLRNS